jgi:RNA-directed DNA polymerase
MTVDYRIWQALWRWARRRHPKNIGGWVRRKYFWTLGRRHGVFAIQTREDTDEPNLLTLRLASDTRIVRHVRGAGP